MWPRPRRAWLRREEDAKETFQSGVAGMRLWHERAGLTGGFSAQCSVHQVQLWRNQDEYKSFFFSFCCILERLTLAWHHTHQTSSFVLLVAPLCIASLVTKGSAASGGFSVFGEWVCWAAQWKECLLSVGGAFCCLNAGGHRWKLQVLYFIVASFWSRNLKSLKIVSRKKRKCFSALISMCLNLKC